MTGHLLGAAGAIEAACCVLAVKNNLVPPTINLQNRDAEIDSRIRVESKACSQEVRAALNNSFGFGGVNAHVLLQAAATPTATHRTMTSAKPPLLLSAQSDAALRTLAAAYAEQLDKVGDEAYYDIAYNAAFHRDRLEKKLIFAGLVAAVLLGAWLVTRGGGKKSEPVPVFVSLVMT